MPTFSLSLARMTVSTHVTVGAAIGVTLHNPILGFIAGFTSHILLDIIPHGDSKLAHKMLVEKRRTLPLIYGIADYIIAIYLLLLFLNILDISNMRAFTFAIAGSILPDLIVVIHEASQRKLFNGFNKIHFFFHDLVSKKHGDLPLLVGIGYQMAFIIFLTGLIK